MKFLVQLSRLAGRYFVVWVLVVSILGYIRPSLFMWVKPLIKPLLGVIMFGMGMTLKAENIGEIARRPWEVLAGVAAQYIVMPLAAFLLAIFFHLPPELAIGVILVGTCPGGTASNVITFLARGDVALSVAMTSVSTLLSPILTPLMTLLLGGHWIPVHAGTLFISICQIVLVPVLLGFLFHRYLPKAVEKGISILPLVSVTAIVLIVGFVIGANSKNLVKIGPRVFTVVILHNGFGLVLGYLIGRVLGMTVKKRRTVSIEVGMQNSGLAVALAGSHFTAMATVPGAIFSVWHNITGPLLATLWSRKPDQASPGKQGNQT